MKNTMKLHTLQIACLATGMLFAPAAFAQAPPPPPGGAAGPGGGGPGGPGGMNRPGGHPLTQQDATSLDRAHNALQFGPVGRWWDDRSVAQQIGLTRDQQRKMDLIFNASKPAIVDAYKTFLKAQGDLEKINKDSAADKAKVFAAVDAVNQARSSLQKATLAMLMQIRGQMAPGQVEKLQKLP